MSPTQTYGQKWEIKLVEQLLKLGTQPVILRTENDWNDQIDIEWGEKLIHCKVAQAKRQRAHDKIWRNRYQFNFSMIDNGDFVIAICDTWGDPVFFIIPLSELTKRGLNVTSHPLIYNGWAAKYRNNWTLLQEAKNVQN